MPKESRSKIRRHAPAAQIPSKRSFALPSAGEVVLPGSGSVQSADGVPGASSSSASASASTSGAGIFGITLPPTPTVNANKRTDFAAQLKAASLPSHPYSRSHKRRENKKQRQLLVGGELTDVASALDVIQGITEGKVEEIPAGKAERLGNARTGNGRRIKGTATATSTDTGARTGAGAGSGTGVPGMIGEGRGLGMKERKKRKQIAIESKRIPAIMQHPAYKADPWATIRLHAANSLELKPVVSAQGLERKGEGVGGEGEGMEVEV